jgi:FkbM family methyltransferase
MGAARAIAKRLASLTDGLLGVLGLKLTTRRVYEDALDKARKFTESEERARKLDLLVALSIDDDLASKLSLSQSQLGQDFVALAASGRKLGGFFVEFGAVDGVTLSNTFLLEKNFGWTGILAEPNPRFFSKISQSRSAAADNRAVGAESGHTVEFLDAGLNSSLYSIRDKGRWAESAPTHQVETVTLRDLLRQHDAPKEIDFLSIDTEGNEFATLAAFDFTEYDISCICVESNGQEEELVKFFSQKNYVAILRDFSKWDLWFVKSDKLGNFERKW